MALFFYIFNAFALPIDIFFSLGLPAPQKAWIECEKINCKRQCIFNQNVVFDETITTFKPNQELTFMVKAKVGKQNILTGIDPHIMPGGLYFNSLKGQYRLKEIKPGLTELSGTSWYSFNSSINWYLIPWTNAIIRAIHLKVFDHIKAQTEN